MTKNKFSCTFGPPRNFLLFLLSGRQKEAKTSRLMLLVLSEKSSKAKNTDFAFHFLNAHSLFLHALRYNGE